MAFCCCLVVSSTFGHWSCVFNFGDAWWQKLQSCLNSSHCPMWQKVTSRILVHEGEWLTWLKPLGSGREHLVECKEALLEELHVSMALPAALCSANIFDPTAEWASGLPSSPASPPNPLHEALIKADGTSKKTKKKHFTRGTQKCQRRKTLIKVNSAAMSWSRCFFTFFVCCLAVLSRPPSHPPFLYDAALWLEALQWKRQDTEF